MKHFFLKSIIALVCIFSFSKSFAQSTVYVIFDHKMGWAELPFSVNGTQAFSLNPEVASATIAGTIYKKVLRKVTFNKPGRYVLSMENTWYGKPYHFETILNLEDNETYYIELDFTIKGGTFKEIPTAKGVKYMQKAEKDKNITINPDIEL